MAAYNDTNQGDGLSTQRVRQSFGTVLEDGTVVEATYDRKRERPLQFLIATPNGKTSLADNYTDSIGRVHLPKDDLSDIEEGAIVLASGIMDFESSAELMEDLYSYVGNYLDFESFDKKLIANWALVTWVYERFGAIPYLRLKGEPGSGKTRCLEVLNQICFRATNMGGAPTRSVLFRTSDSVRGTLLIDEADYAGDLTSGIAQVLNIGFKTDGRVRVNEPVKGGKWKPVSYFAGGPKAIANRQEFGDRATETRSITIQTVMKPIASVPASLDDRFYEEGAALRMKLLKWRIDNVRNLDRSEEALNQLPGRSREIGISLHNCSPDLDFRRELIAKLDERFKELQNEDPAQVVVEALRDCAVGVEDGKAIYTKDVQKVISAILSGRGLPHYEYTAKRVPELLLALRFKLGKHRHGRIVYVDHTIIDEQSVRFNLTDDAVSEAA